MHIGLFLHFVLNQMSGTSFPAVLHVLQSYRSDFYPPPPTLLFPVAFFLKNTLVSHYFAAKTINLWSCELDALRGFDEDKDELRDEKAAVWREKKRMQP